MKRLFSKKGRSPLPEYWQRYEARFRETLPLGISDNVFVVLDTETTGFHLEKDRMLSLGALKLQQGKIAIRECLEIHIAQQHYDTRTAAIHGLRKQGLQDRIPESQALEEFLAYTENHVLVGHHVLFDVNMINAALGRQGLPNLRNPTLDTGLLYKRTLLTTSVLQKKESYTLDDLAEKYGLSRKDRHTALGDALLTAYAFLRILGELSPGSLKELMGKQRPPRFGL